MITKDQKKVTDMFGNKVSSVRCDVESKIGKPTNYPTIEKTVSNSLYCPEIQPEEIMAARAEIKQTSSIGEDDISSKVIKSVG